MTQTESHNWGSVLLVLGRIALAVIFLLAAYGKLRPQSATPWTLNSLHITPASLNISMTFFAMQVDSYQMLPAWAVLSFARALPWIEFGLGILLLSGLVVRYSSLAAAVLIGIFYGVVIRSYALHLAINCGCFGPNEKLDKWTLIRDGIFFALGIAVTVGAFLLHRRDSRTTGSLARGSLQAE